MRASHPFKRFPGEIAHHQSTGIREYCLPAPVFRKPCINNLLTSAEFRILRSISKGSPSPMAPFFRFSSSIFCRLFFLPGKISSRDEPLQRTSPRFLGSYLCPSTPPSPEIKPISRERIDLFIAVLFFSEQEMDRHSPVQPQIEQEKDHHESCPRSRRRFRRDPDTGFSSCRHFSGVSYAR